MQPELIVGLCRFSYLGLGDWSAYRTDKSTDPDRMAQMAEFLFDETRMADRFRAFEALCLPSVLAQNDPRFIFLILASPVMPRPWRERLQRLCAPHDAIHLHWSDAPSTGEALRQPLAELHDLCDGRLWQFRLDDDDAISAGYLRILRQHIARMAGLQTGAISIATGVNLCLYGGQAIRYQLYRTPFQSAGAAVRLSDPARSIFGYGHFKLPTRFSHFVDQDRIGALMLKWPSDSRPLDLDRPAPGTVEIDAQRFRRIIERDFPTLAETDWETLRATARPPA